MNRINFSTRTLTIVAGAALLGLFVLHLGCNQQGSGGNNDFTQGLAKLGGDIGSRVTGHSEISQGVNAAVEYQSKVSLTAADEDAMGQSVAMSLTSSNQLTSNEKLNKYVSL